jgi:hypothetical protein
MRADSGGESVLITSVLNILDRREYETKVSPPAETGKQFRVSIPEKTDETPAVETRVARDKQFEAEGLGRPPLPQEPLFTTLPSQKAVDEFLRAMEEARAKGKSRSVDIFE